MCTTEFKAPYGALPNGTKARIRRSFLNSFNMVNRTTFYKKINGKRPLSIYEINFLSEQFN